jgi:predicted nucleic acid-binding protein
MNADDEMIFLDTNILVYAYDRSAGIKHELAARLMETCWENHNACISMQILQEFFVTVTRKIAHPMEHFLARQIVADLLQWKLHISDSKDLLQAIDFHKSFQLSFWDAMVIQSALRLGCTHLYSEDLSSGQKYDKVLVLNPFQAAQ